MKFGIVLRSKYEKVKRECEKLEKEVETLSAAVDNLGEKYERFVLLVEEKDPALAAEVFASLNAKSEGTLKDAKTPAEEEAMLRAEKEKERRLKISKAMKGHFVSEETRKKIGDSNRGKKRSPRVRRNISAGKKREKARRERGEEVK